MSQNQDRSQDVAGALQRAKDAVDNVKRAIEQGSIGELGGRAAEAASQALHEVEDLVARSETLTEAEAKLRSAVLRRPLTSLALAFSAGLALALLTRG